MRNAEHRMRMTGRSALLAVGSSLLLTACTTYNDVVMDSYEPTSVTERYPIRVEKAPVKMGVVSASGGLKPDQVNAVIGFANEAKTAGMSGITVRYPSGSAKGRAAAQEVAKVIAAQGVPSSMIHLSSHRGGATAPVEISFMRKVAVTKECGDWSRNIANNWSNEPYPNFGCSMQHNVAAMVANPEDFENPRGMSPVLAANRLEVMKVYYANETAGDYYALDGLASNAAGDK